MEEKVSLTDGVDPKDPRLVNEVRVYHNPLFCADPSTCQEVPCKWFRGYWLDRLMEQKVACLEGQEHLFAGAHGHRCMYCGTPWETLNRADPLKIVLAEMKTLREDIRLIREHLYSHHGELP